MMKGSAKRLKRALDYFPWLSKRRNKKWYQLAREGAALFPKLVKDFQLTEDIYRQSGTVILRPAAALADLAHLAEERKQTAPEIEKSRCCQRFKQRSSYRYLRKLPHFLFLAAVA